MQQQQIPQEKFSEANSLAQCIPISLTTERKREFKMRVLAALLDAFNTSCGKCTA